MKRVIFFICVNIFQGNVSVNCLNNFDCLSSAVNLCLPALSYATSDKINAPQQLYPLSLVFKADFNYSLEDSVYKHLQAMSVFVAPETIKAVVNFVLLV